MSFKSIQIPISFPIELALQYRAECEATGISFTNLVLRKLGSAETANVGRPAKMTAPTSKPFSLIFDEDEAHRKDAEEKALKAAQQPAQKSRPKRSL
jgi:hypothetical protein